MFVDFKKCFNDPKQLLRLVTLLICICIACYQLSACVQKILHPPKATRYDFVLNKTLNYPSVTICRNPGFKTARFQKYGVSDKLIYSSSWRDYKFDNYTLEEFFDEVTFKIEDFIVIYSFDGYDSNLTISSFFTLTYGKCFKFMSINLSPLWNSNAGYFFYLRHADDKGKRSTEEEYYKFLNYSKFGKIGTYGFHVFLNDRNEMFTESPNQQEVFVEYVYLQQGEELEVNIKAEEFSKLSVKDDHCNSDHDYSYSKCKEQCAYKHITETVGCQVPWMTNNNLPTCNNYNSIRSIIQLYSNFTENPEDLIKECNCIKSCKINVFTPFVTSRKDKGSPASWLTIYFSSNLISKMYEVMAYDWNLFLADLGGSLGFLLGLSVLSTIAAIEKMFEIFVKKKTNNESKENNISEKNNQETSIQDLQKYLYENEKSLPEIDKKNMFQYNFLTNNNKHCA